MTTAKTTAQRQADFRRRKAQSGEKEVRGIFAHADDHEPIKTHAAKLAKRRGRKVTPQPAACSTAG